MPSSSRPIRPAKSKLPYLDPVAAERDRLRRDVFEWREAIDAYLERIDWLEEALRAIAARAYGAQDTDEDELEQARWEIQAMAEHALLPRPREVPE